MPPPAELTFEGLAQPFAQPPVKTSGRNNSCAARRPLVAAIHVGGQIRTGIRFPRVFGSVQVFDAPRGGSLADASRPGIGGNVPARDAGLARFTTAEIAVKFVITIHDLLETRVIRGIAEDAAFLHPGVPGRGPVVHDIGAVTHVVGKVFLRIARGGQSRTRPPTLGGPPLPEGLEPLFLNRVARWRDDYLRATLIWEKALPLTFSMAVAKLEPIAGHDQTFANDILDLPWAHRHGAATSSPDLKMRQP